MGKYQSGQMGQTVNLLGRGFEPRLPLYRRDDLIISSFILHRPVFFITQQCSKLFNF